MTNNVISLSGGKDYWRATDFERRFSREEKFPVDFPAHVVRRLMKDNNLFDAMVAE